MVNEIYLRRKNKVLLEQGNSTPSLSYIATINKNIETLGYTFSQSVIETLTTYSIDQLESFYLELIPTLKKIIGSHVAYKPMYPNFPQQVMEASECELYINAIFHYLTFGDILPQYEKLERLPLFEEKKLKVINLGNVEEFKSIFKNLILSKTSISETDTEDLTWYFLNNDNVDDILPDQIPLKENVALVSKLVIESDKKSVNLHSYFNTATDVLRLAVALSDGDISLAENTKFKSFKRKQRRLLLSLLENCSNIEEDMKRYKNRWVRLGERLHPSEYKTFYPNTQEAFNKLRNNIKIETFNGKVDESMKSNIDEAIDLLKQRPGEFARKLDNLIRNHPNPNVVINEFKQVANDVSTPVLLQVLTHFKNRNSHTEKRVFFPKGNVAKLFVVDNDLPEIPSNVADNVAKICESALVQNYKQKDYLGKVYIDENLKNYIVPFSQRSASKTLKTVARGSKLDINSGTKTIRSFIYWREPKHDRVDIDLSAVMYNEDWEYLEHVSYTNLRSSKYNATHSGDITSAPHGASEFIDLDVESVKQYGGRYVVISLNSYTDQPFADLPECFMGWMNRENPNSGEIYEPKTVENKVDVTASSRVCIPVILDLHENKVIWTDISLSYDPEYSNNVENNQFGMVLMGKAMTSLRKANLYELFDLHVKARGEYTDNQEEADIVFSLNSGVTPYDQDIIIAEYL